MVEAVVEDDTGLLNLVFFNQPWRERQLAVGTEVALYGKLDLFRGKRQLANPIVDVLGTAGDAKTGVDRADLPAVGEGRRVDVGDPDASSAPALDWVGDLADPLSADLRAELKNLPDRTWAYRHVHQPESATGRQARRSGGCASTSSSASSSRSSLRKRAIEAERGGIEHQVDGELVDRFLGALPVRADRATSSARST